VSLANVQSYVQIWNKTVNKKEMKELSNIQALIAQLIERIGNDYQKPTFRTLNCHIVPLATVPSLETHPFWL
jgi:hypothetical protein